VPGRLETERLHLRRVQPEDARALLAYLSGPRVFESTSSDPWTPQAVEQLIAAAVTAGDDGGFICLVIELRATGELCGMVRMGSFDERNRRAELGYDLAPEHWGQGYMHEAVSALLRFVFEQGLFRAEATVMCGNVRSERVLEHLGFQREGVLRGYKQVRGEPRDFTMFGLLASDWRDANARE
jgi:[ribosomal protein S5]-alanine N-acetyltransferase